MALTVLVWQRSLEWLVPGCLMSRVLVSLLLFSLLACSIEQTDDLTDAQLETRYANFDVRLRAMLGATERQLLGAMGRIPDTSYPLGDQTKVLQWWWDVSPSCSPRREISAVSPSPVRESFCVVEWTVSKGTSQTFHWQGYGCRSVTFEYHSPSVLSGRDAF
jgi:hypothetical protein